MHCRSCGRINRLDAMYCDGCGACLTTPVSPTPELSVTADAHHTEGEGRLRPDHSHPSKPAEKEVFVGRQREMEVLKAALEEALSGRGRVVMLVGDPGIGQDAHGTGAEYLCHTTGSPSALGALLREPRSPTILAMGADYPRLHRRPGYGADQGSYGQRGSRHHWPRS